MCWRHAAADLQIILAPVLRYNFAMCNVCLTREKIMNTQTKKNGGSPYCTGHPINTLAEPEDLVIVCGEFNSGVQIVSQSGEPEQVFTIKKIVNHPDYKPNGVP